MRRVEVVVVVGVERNDDDCDETMGVNVDTKAMIAFCRLVMMIDEDDVDIGCWMWEVCIYIYTFLSSKNITRQPMKCIVNIIQPGNGGPTRVYLDRNLSLSRT